MNQPVFVAVAGLNPFEQVELFLGTGGPGPGPCFPQFGGLCLDMLDPVQPLGPVQADPNGLAATQLPLPPGLQGLDLMLQAIAPRGPAGVDSVKSNAARGPGQ